MLVKRKKRLGTAGLGCHIPWPGVACPGTNSVASSSMRLPSEVNVASPGADGSGDEADCVAVNSQEPTMLRC
jgi:hypothetical protein